MTSPDWFSRLTGFTERDYASTQARLAVDGEDLLSSVNGKRYGIGCLALRTLAELRSQVKVPDGRRSTARAWWVMPEHCTRRTSSTGIVPGRFAVQSVGDGRPARHS